MKPSLPPIAPSIPPLHPFVRVAAIAGLLAAAGCAGQSTTASVVPQMHTATAQRATSDLSAVPIP